MSSPCQILPFTAESLKSLAARLREGKLVAFPTETVYGLGANALDPSACLKIFETKKRPLTDPLIVHITSVESALSLVSLSEKQKKIFLLLAKKFWPGPFTFVLPANEKVPKEVTGATGWVGVRFPNHPAAVALIDAAGVPIAAPSANLFMHVSPTSAAHVFDDFFDQDVFILDDGHSTFGIESTILKVGDNEGVFLRLGSLACSDVLQFLHGENGLSDYGLTVKKKHKEEHEKVEAPGQFLKHYSPRISAFILSEKKEIFNLAQTDLSKTVLLDFNGKFKKLEKKVILYESLSEKGSVAEAMTKLYFLLRAAENVKDAERVLVVDLEQFRGKLEKEEEKHLDAMVDKIFRACSGHRASIGD